MYNWLEEKLKSYKSLMKWKMISRVPLSRYKKRYCFFCTRLNIFFHLKGEYQFYVLICYCSCSCNSLKYSSHENQSFVLWLKEKSEFLLVDPFSSFSKFCTRIASFSQTLIYSKVSTAKCLIKLRF